FWFVASQSSSRVDIEVAMDVTTERSSATSSRLVDVTAFCASRYAGLDSNCLVKRSRSSGFSARPLLCPLVPIGVLHLCVRMRRSAQTGAYARTPKLGCPHICGFPKSLATGYLRVTVRPRRRVAVEADRHRRLALRKVVAAAMNLSARSSLL